MFIKKCSKLGIPLAYALEELGIAKIGITLDELAWQEYPRNVKDSKQKRYQLKKRFKKYREKLNLKEGKVR